jgi:hypothetical protein
VSSEQCMWIMAFVVSCCVCLQLQVRDTNKQRGPPLLAYLLVAPMVKRSFQFTVLYCFCTAFSRRYRWFPQERKKTAGDQNAIALD